MAVFGQQLRITGDQPAQPRRRPVPPGGAGIVAAYREGDRDDPTTDDDDRRGGGTGAINLDNILRLIPADIVSIYVTARGIALATTGAPHFVQTHWSGVVFWTCLVTCIVFRMIACKPPGTPGLFASVNWSLVVVTAIAFFIWAHVVSDPPPVIPGFSGGYAGFFAMIFGVLAPKLVRAD